MALLFKAGCVLAILCLVTAQTDIDLDSVLAQIFPESGENTTTNNPLSAGEDESINLTSSTTLIGEHVDGTGNCTCVPFYLCKTRVKEDLCEDFFETCCARWNTDGSGLIDIM